MKCGHLDLHIGADPSGANQRATCEALSSVLLRMADVGLDPRATCIADPVLERLSASWFLKQLVIVNT